MSRSLLLAAALWCAAAPAAIAVHPVVSGFERFHAEGDDPAAGGQLLLGELNCTSCHAAEKSPLWMAKEAPILDSVGTRVRPEYIRAFLANPHGTKPGTTMPDPFAGWDMKEKEKAVEALTHYLALTGVPQDQRIEAANVSKGDDLYHKLGCVACHDPQRPEAKTVATSVPLGNLGAKYTLPGLATFLQDPSKVRPASRMPALNLQGDEAKHLASYLLRDLKDLRVPANLKYAFYEGSWEKLPDFEQLTPSAQGETNGFLFDFAPKKDNFAVRFTGIMQLPKDGTYKFSLGSDDGSKLYIDGKVVVDNDLIHGTVYKDGSAKLTAGKHAVQVDFFEAAGGEELYVQIEGNGLPNQPLENLLVVEKAPEIKEKPKFVADPALAAEGKQLFATAGCASCHTLHAGNEKIGSRVEAPALAMLKTSGGCLSEKPNKGTPHYSLNDAQRKALGEGIAALKKPAEKLAVEETIARTMKTLNCYACHQRGEIGGVEELRDAHFQTTQKEMGDEGRLPPPLTGVGAKLKPEYLKQQLEQANKERPYMLTRMPRFAGYPFQDLIAAVQAADPVPELKTVNHKFAERELKHGGYTLVGSKGHSCIKCHTWGNIQATGIQSINMQRMAARLRPEWFEAYMVNPSAFRPGTRMPAAWPDGQVTLPKILDGQADTQIRSIWEFLADGEKARMPLGLGRDPIELVADKEPVIYRNFIEGGGPRAIGVGYPEKVNLAFDANNLRLAMIWQGAFMDASKHWVDRGAGYQPPLGENVLSFPNSVPLAELADENAAWPTKTAKELGYRFKGYRYDEARRPIFLYQFGDAEITDKFEPGGSSEQPSLKRTITIKSTKPLDHVYFRAAVDDGMKSEDGGLFAMSGKWHLKLSGDGKPLVRQNSGKSELLVPATLKDGEWKIVQEFIW